MKKILKLITINIIMFLGILLLLNFVVIFVYQVYQVYQRLSMNKNSNGDTRHGLPN